MLSPKNLGRDEGSSTSAKLPCDSPLREVRGLDVVKLSKYYPRGSVLFVEGQRPRGVYVLCEGRAKVSISSAEGKTLVLRIALPGDLLGLNSALTGLPHDATVATLENCRIDFVSRADFTKLLDRSKIARVSLSEALSRQLSEVIERARSLLLSQSAAEKLARLLLKWCDELGKPTPQGIRLNHGLTQEEIAQMICSSRETVSRLLTELKLKQIVRLNGTGIYVRNRVALELVAGM
ncbi:MAG: Crp/Fnr family transcriptional regulator [Pyrinomonadaceae bacterium]|nr:Crp/Fnr family transcriptional regulator [Pyrinomonadaceae bacterium]